MGGGSVRAGMTGGRWECQGVWGRRVYQGGGIYKWQVGRSGSGGGSDSWQVGLRRRFGSQVAGGSVRAVRVLVWVRGKCGD